MLNASECCRTIGCNCAGTQSVEAINKFLKGDWIWGFVELVVIIGVLGFAVLLYFIYKDKKFRKQELNEKDNSILSSNILSSIQGKTK